MTGGYNSTPNHHHRQLPLPLQIRQREAGPLPEACQDAIARSQLRKCQLQVGLSSCVALLIMPIRHRCGKMSLLKTCLVCPTWMQVMEPMHFWRLDPAIAMPHVSCQQMSARLFGICYCISHAHIKMSHQLCLKALYEATCDPFPEAPPSQATYPDEEITEVLAWSELVFALSASGLCSVFHAGGFSWKTNVGCNVSTW
jgi:hypothetical protein